MLSYVTFLPGIFLAFLPECDSGESLYKASCIEAAKGSPNRLILLILFFLCLFISVDPPIVIFLKPPVGMIGIKYAGGQFARRFR